VKFWKKVPFMVFGERDERVSNVTHLADKLAAPLFSLFLPRRGVLSGLPVNGGGRNPAGRHGRVSRATIMGMRLLLSSGTLSVWAASKE